MCVTVASNVLHHECSWTSQFSLMNTWYFITSSKTSITFGISCNCSVFWSLNVHKAWSDIWQVLVNKSNSSSKQIDICLNSQWRFPQCSGSWTRMQKGAFRHYSKHTVLPRDILGLNKWNGRSKKRGRDAEWLSSWINWPYDCIMELVPKVLWQCTVVLHKLIIQDLLHEVTSIADSVF